MLKNEKLSSCLKMKSVYWVILSILNYIYSLSNHTSVFGVAAWAAAFITGFNKNGFPNICIKTIAVIIHKQSTVTDDADIYWPLPSSPVIANIFPFLAVNLSPESPSVFFSLNLYLLFGFVLDIAIDLANSFLRAISSASVIFLILYLFLLILLFTNYWFWFKLIKISNITFSI